MGTSLYQERAINILITGTNGFIGKALPCRLASGNKVIGADITGPADGAFNIAWEQADPLASPEPARHSPEAKPMADGRELWRAGLTEGASVTAICEKHSLDGFVDLAQ